MRTLLFTGLMASAASLAPMAASAQVTTTQSTTMMSAPMMNAPINRGGTTIIRSGGMGMGNSWGSRVNGRWSGGYQAPGGWNGYRRPVSGYVLPSYWLQPRYYISDYRAYGLPVPQSGYGWSRYYDDAVLTDEYGAVYDSRASYDWDRFGGYDDGPAGAAYAPGASYAPGPAYAPGYSYDDSQRDLPRERKHGVGDNIAGTIGGAIIGGVTGGLLGAAIAGPGQRVLGAVFGGGLGTVVGAAVGDASGKGRGHYADGRAVNERALAKEEARQRVKLDKMARKAGYASYEDYLRAQAPHMAGPMAGPPTGPHWALHGGPEGHPMPGASVHGGPRIAYQQLPGYVANGYYYPGATITTITIEPSVVSTTRTSYVTTRTVATSAKKKIVRRKIVRASCTC